MTDNKRYPLLCQIDDPARLRQLAEAQLPQVADELRDFLINSVSRTGGHLASNLGTVELTVALHYVFNTPEDRIVWDVGHQSYAHKILTGRRTRMAGIRQDNGISGFPRREESIYDAFGVGHSSTSISAALGMALACAALDSDRQVIAVIGDGAMTAGMAFEALNHAGDLKPDLLVILNDNDMSISRNVGALSKYLGQILSSRFYATIREGSKKVLQHVPSMHEFARRTEEHVKGMIVPGTLFEELGFNYIGPVDGHDLPGLVRTLRNIKQLNGLQLLHVVTKKGKGFAPAEDDPCEYHGVSAFDVDIGIRPAQAGGKQTYTQIFGEWLCAMAAADSRLIGITPAMCEGSGLVRFAEQFPQRYFDVGIAEQHAITMAAGLACEGMKPVVAIYSTFLQRAYDQLLHDVALQNLPVLFAIDRAGVVGADGPTHHGAFDLSYLRCLPNVIIMAPADEAECRAMLTTGFYHDGPAAVRYPRGFGPGADIPTTLETVPIGRAQTVLQGEKIAILAFGSMVVPALEAGRALRATVVNMRFIKPLDADCITRLAASHQRLVTVEENAIAGGAGSGVNEFLAQQGIVMPVLNLGLPDQFIEHGATPTLLARYGLTAAALTQTIARFGDIVVD